MNMASMAEELFKHCLERDKDDIVFEGGTALEMAKWLVRTNMLDQCPVCGSYIGVNIDCDCCEVYSQLKKEADY